VPNQLGVDYNAHVIESILKHVAPALGWRWRWLRCDEPVVQLVSATNSRPGLRWKGMPSPSGLLGG